MDDPLFVGAGGTHIHVKSFSFVEYQHNVHKLPLFVDVHKNMIYCVAELMCPLLHALPYLRRYLNLQNNVTSSCFFICIWLGNNTDFFTS